VQGGERGRPAKKQKLRNETLRSEPEVSPQGKLSLTRMLILKPDIIYELYFKHLHLRNQQNLPVDRTWSLNHHGVFPARE
jgi:hypothetical protein